MPKWHPSERARGKARADIFLDAITFYFKPMEKWQKKRQMMKVSEKARERDRERKRVGEDMLPLLKKEKNKRKSIKE